MTQASSPSNSNPSLKLVPPTTGLTSFKSIPSTEGEEALKTPSDASLPGATPPSPLPVRGESENSQRRWLFSGAALLILGAISFIPLPSYVTGTAAIMSRPDARQRVVVPVSGRVQVIAKTNQVVQPGQLLGEVQSDELDDRLAEAQREFDRAVQGVSNEQQGLMLATARLTAASQNEAIAKERRARSQQDLNQSAVAPAIERLQQEQAVLPEEMAAIEAEIAGLEGEIMGLEGQLRSLEKTVAAYQSLQADGAIRRTDLWDIEGQRAVLAGQIAQRRATIEARQRQVRQQQRLMAAKAAQMGEVRQQLGDAIERDSDELGQVTAMTQTARSEVAAASARVASQQQLAAKWKGELERLLVQRQKLKLVAQTTGTVVTPDLDLLSGTRVEAGHELLSVVDLSSLTARVQIRQEDKDLVVSGARVRFFRQGDSMPYAAVVESGSIVPVVQTEAVQMKPMVEVRIRLENPEGLLLPGIEGYAHIRTSDLRVYQKVGREFNKLFNVGKYFPGLEGV